MNFHLQHGISRIRPVRKRAPSSQKVSTETIREIIRDLKKPPGLFSGLSWNQAMVPDNIVFFKRTDAATLRSVLGVSSNYHHRFELLVVLEQGGSARVGENTFRLEPGECVLVFPHQFHHYTDIGEGPIEWLFITFELAESAALASLRDHPVVLDQEALRLVRDVVTEHVHPANGEEDVVEIAYRLSQLLKHLVYAPPIPEERRGGVKKSDDSRDVILERINREVRSNLAHAPGIEELAQRLGYSASHLRAMFRSNLGISLGKYIRESRLAEAAKLLQSTNLQVTEVAQKSGFESLFAFSRAFKKAYGMAPTAYAKMVGEGAIPIGDGKPEW